MRLKTYKAELIHQVALSADVSKVSANKVISETLAVMAHALPLTECMGHDGFGTFDVSDRQARIGRNPKTGKKMKIPATRVPRFRPGKLLKVSVANKI